MKKYSWLIAIFLGLGIFIVSACCDDDDGDEAGYCSEEGVIIGFDYRLCPCCGGWFIEIGNDTLRAYNLPQEFLDSFDPGEVPLPVYLEWSNVATPCLGDEIEVQCIRR